MILTNGRVFNGRKFLKENTVEVKGGKIFRIYFSKNVPEGAVDLAGKYLRPDLLIFIRMPQLRWTFSL
jgi:N-acetylglucosamine-6-phosphate deacetylase